MCRNGAMPRFAVPIQNRGCLHHGEAPEKHRPFREHFNFGTRDLAQKLSISIGSSLTLRREK